MYIFCIYHQKVLAMYTLLIVVHKSWNYSKNSDCYYILNTFITFVYSHVKFDNWDIALTINISQFLTISLCCILTLLYFIPFTRES